MNTLTTLSLLAILVATVLAARPPSYRRENRKDGSGYDRRGPGKNPGYDRRGPGKNPGYGRRGPGKNPGYDGPNPGYGPIKTPGYGPTPVYKPGVPGYDGPSGSYAYAGGKFPVNNYPYPDDLDKIYFRLDTALAQIKIYSEMIDSLAARLSLQKKFLDELKLVIVPGLKETDERQDNLIAKLWSHLGDLRVDIKDLAAHVDYLSETNHQNVKRQEKAEILWAKERRFDVKQEGEIATLFARVKDFKPKLFQVKANYFETFYDSVELETVRLGSIKARENRRMCETGRVTLKSDDRRIEASYQTWFDKAPQIVYGICGYSIDLDASDYKGYDYRNRYGYKNWHNTYDNGYGYGYYYNTPEAIGLRALAYTTKSAFIVEGVQLSFGESQAITADICYQACTIDPGVGPVVHP